MFYSDYKTYLLFGERSSKTIHGILKQVEIELSIWSKIKQKDNKKL